MRLGRPRRSSDDHAFLAGVGVHFGTAVLGSFGSSDRKDFTVMGDTVNTASRVEGLTKDHPHPILITRAVFERLPEDLQRECAPLGSSSVKGRAGSVELYGLGAWPSSGLEPIAEADLP